MSSTKTLLCASSLVRSSNQELTSSLSEPCHCSQWMFPQEMPSVNPATTNTSPNNCQGTQSWIMLCSPSLQHQISIFFLGPEFRSQILTHSCKVVEILISGTGYLQCQQAPSPCLQRMTTSAELLSKPKYLLVL